MDIGGTKIAAGVVRADGCIVERTRIPTPQETDEKVTISALVEVIDGLRAAHPQVEAIGVGAAGLVQWPAGLAIWAPHNPYRDLQLRRLLHERTGLPTVVDNDANAAAWAEARFGAGTGSDHMILLTVGTGVGGGMVLGGRPYRGLSGLGAEFGHMIVAPDGAPCSCGSSGCLEAMVSGTALARMGREAILSDPQGGLARRAGAEEVTGPMVFEAAKAGEHGKGFAVVATEVRNLAEQSKQATQQVRGILGDIQKATTAAVLATEQGTKVVEQGLTLTEQANAGIGNLVATIQEAAQAAQVIAASAHQQSTGLDQIAQAMKDVNEGTTQFVASAQQSQRAAEDLNDLAGRLSSVTDQYQVSATP
jgi:glucokinase-like ROK family protein